MTPGISRGSGLRAITAVLLVAGGCEQGDLDSALEHGACGPNGECAAGYACNGDDQCVEAHGTGGSSGAAGSAGTGGSAGASPCGTCAAEQTCCGTGCVDLRSDSENCGKCGRSCQGAVCLSSNCTNQCLPELADCNHNAVDGCEAPATSCPEDGGGG